MFSALPGSEENKLPTEYIKSSATTVPRQPRALRQLSHTRLTKIKHKWMRKLGEIQGRAIAQAVSRRLPTAAMRVRARVRLCRICGEQSGTGASIYLSIYGSTALCWILAAFSLS
jgi:hypothetical protein